MEAKQEVLDILVTDYGVIPNDVVEVIRYQDIIEKGYGEPAKKGVHAMHFPEDPGFYYIIRCDKNMCSICFA